MLPKLSVNQNVFIEITNPTHGGIGWDFGSCLWSPVKDKAGAKAWKIMEKIRSGDIIIHLLKTKNGYHWTAVSIADTSLIRTQDEPPKADRWKNMSPYQRIGISQFVRLDPTVPISTFFNKYEKELKKILSVKPKNQFYVKYGKKQKLRLAQKYIAVASKSLYELFNDYSNKIKFNYSIIEKDLTTPTKNEPVYPDYTKPGRIKTYESRIIRDTIIVRDLKKSVNWKCQICGKRIIMPSGNYYAEGHHIKPLGDKFNGPDVKENIIILCPYHHAEFDYGSIAINPTTKIIEHINNKNKYHNTLLAYSRVDIDLKFLAYHYKNIFGKT